MEPWYRAAELALVPMQLWFNWRLEGLEKIPRGGAGHRRRNHLSYVDPLAHGYYVTKAGRRPRFLAKQELFDAPFVGDSLRGRASDLGRARQGRPISARGRGPGCRARRGGRDLPRGDDHHNPQGLPHRAAARPARFDSPRDGGPDPPGRDVGGPVRPASVRAPEPHVRTADPGGRRRTVRPIRVAGWRAQKGGGSGRSPMT